MSGAPRRIALLAAALLVAGCATWQPPAAPGDAGLRQRAVSASEKDVRVSAAVLSAQDSRAMLGGDVNATGVQPVWIEVQNRRPEPLWLLRSGIDPDYFSPHEIAQSLHRPLSSGTNERIDEYFNELAFANPVPANGTRAGLVFTNRDRGTKLLTIDLLQSNRIIPFTLFVPVPDDAANPRFAQRLFEYPAREVRAYEDLPDLRATLERLPCCAADARGAPRGEPLNAVFVGDLADTAAALVRRGYRREPREFDLEQRLYGRPPDVVLRKQSRASAAQWLRAWLVPERFRGEAVYVVQVGRPAGGRFADPRAPEVLHGDVDEARNLLVQDMMYSGGLEKLGFVGGVGASSGTDGGVRYHTDGLRAVLFFSTRPSSMADVEILDWVPLQGGASAEKSGSVE